MRNIEIKAKVRNSEEFYEKVEKLAGKVGVLNQVDYFFDIPKDRGRLKLRVENNENNGTLIFYKRPDQSGPKLSKYTLFRTDNPVSLITTLDLSIGIKGKVHKSRTLFMYGQTRIHYDQVAALGDYMELEVVLEDHQSVEEGERIAKDIMEKLGIQEEDLEEEAYFDLLYNLQ